MGFILAQMSFHTQKGCQKVIQKWTWESFRASFLTLHYSPNTRCYMSCLVVQPCWVAANMKQLQFPSSILSLLSHSLLLLCRLSFSRYPYVMCTRSPLPLSFHGSSALAAPHLPPSLIAACSPLCVPADDRAETDAECSMMAWQTYAHLVVSPSVPLCPLLCLFPTSELSFLLPGKHLTDSDFQRVAMFHAKDPTFSGWHIIWW